LSDLWLYALAAGLVAVAAAGLLLLRVLPLLRGRTGPDEPPARRRAKWNRHLVPFLRRTLKDKAHVAAAAEVPATEAQGPPASLSVWCLVKTIVPEVDWLALARPQAGAGGAVVCGEVLGAVPAARLREILSLDVHRQDLFGHAAYVYVWPADAEARLAEVVAELVPLDVFQTRYQWTPPVPGAPPP
jgi:hypothetical protein